MNFRFAGAFFRQSTRHMFSGTEHAPPVKGRGFATAALRMQDLYTRKLPQVAPAKHTADAFQQLSADRKPLPAVGEVTAGVGCGRAHQC